jgi:hypothetical protein
VGGNKGVLGRRYFCCPKWTPRKPACKDFAWAVEDTKEELQELETTPAPIEPVPMAEAFPRMSRMVQKQVGGSAVPGARASSKAMPNSCS